MSKTITVPARNEGIALKAVRDEFGPDILFQFVHNEGARGDTPGYTFAVTFWQSTEKNIPGGVLNPDPLTSARWLMWEMLARVSGG